MDQQGAVMLVQLLNVMKDMSNKLKLAYERGDFEELKLIKKELRNVQKKIGAILK